MTIHRKTNKKVMTRHAERDIQHSICVYLMSSTIDLTVAFVVHTETLQTFCLAWRVACQMRAKTGTVKYWEAKVVKEQRTVLKPFNTKLFHCPIVSKELRNSK